VCARSQHPRRIAQVAIGLERDGEDARSRLPAPRLLRRVRHIPRLGAGAASIWWYWTSPQRVGHAMRSDTARHHFSFLMAFHTSAESRDVLTGLVSQAMAASAFRRSLVLRYRLRNPSALEASSAARWTRAHA